MVDPRTPTVTKCVPVGVEADVTIVMVFEHVGVQDDLEKVAVAPGGRSFMENVTGPAVPELYVAVRVLVTEDP
ncbi:MAG: hypothetical protein G01um101470_690 [Parcubacteria group bacterium Gr01-1014_70]|nr:MAG: hypothetical protein G01um101470_690 [Parcubacteria group bacterium Gr01-1014_70]